VSDPALPPSRRYLTLLVASLSLIALSCIAFLVPVPYVTMRPGPAFNTLGEFEGSPMFTFGDGVKTYPTSGKLRFTTVSVTRAQSRVSLAEAFEAYFADDTAVVPRSFVYREGQSAGDARKEGQAQLASSKDSSRVAALRAAGYTVPEEARIETVNADGAARGILRVGDVIHSVDGRRTPGAKSVVDAVSRVDPGDAVDIGYIRQGERATVEIVTRPDPMNARQPRIGVAIRSRFDFPVTITNNVGEQVGGPSAGSMFALAIYDRLTPGALTGGSDIAGTGEVTSDGVVRPIGGIRQKIAGAAAEGADVFLVPTANCADAVSGGAHGMRLVEVATVKSAIDSLEALAEDRRALVPECR
jgi:PDZ domain-containing protein